MILEFFLSAPFGQLQYFEKNGSKVEPIYNNEVMDSHKKKKIEEIYSYVIEFFNRINELNQIYDLDVNKSLLCNSNTSLVESNIIDRKVKDEFEFMDSFNDSEPKNVFKIISRY